MARIVALLTNQRIYRAGKLLVISLWWDDETTKTLFWGVAK
jgi:hypothetical protein